MSEKARFDDDAIEREFRFKSDLGKELLGFIDDKREPYEYAIIDEDAEDDQLDLQSTGIAPFVTRGEDDDV